MGIKNIQKTEDSTALAVQQQMTGLLPIDPTQGTGSVSNPDAALPTLKIVYPVEIDPSRGLPPDSAYKVGLFNGSSFTALPVNSTLVVISARNACRRLEVELPDGTKAPADKNNPAHANLDKHYTRYFQGIQKHNATDAEFRKSVGQPGWDAGATYLLAVIRPDGSACMASLDAFKTSASYWFAPLRQAGLFPTDSCPGKLGCQLLAVDHSANLTASSRDKNLKYLDPKKFTQFKIRELTPADVQAIMAALEASKNEVEQWFAR